MKKNITLTVNQIAITCGVSIFIGFVMGAGLILEIRKILATII